MRDAIWANIRVLWDFNQMHHQLRRCSVGIGLGSHDPHVPEYTAHLFHLGLYPRIVFTGANAPTTIERFPRGEAIHFRAIALEHGVPESAILVEPRATNTEQNLTLSLDLLAENGVEVNSVLLVTRPYQQRRAYATCKRLRPDLDVTCASMPTSLLDYYRSIGDFNLVTEMLVGDTQRVIEYPRRGLAIQQDVPDDVKRAFQALVDEGFTARLIKAGDDHELPSRHLSQPLYEQDPVAWNEYLAEGNAKQARKRVGVDALIRDRVSRVLVVNPSYKPDWDLPGGMAEANETPLDALRRELTEELGLQPPQFKLLCVDWVPPDGPWDDELAFIFDGGVLPDARIAELSLQDSELTEYRFVEHSQLGDLLRPRLQRRVEVALDVLRTGGEARYLQDGRPLVDARAERAARRQEWARGAKASPPPPGPVTGPDRSARRPRRP